MKLFITKKKLIKELAEEMAYLKIRADYWYYVSELSEVTRRKMSSNEIEEYDEVRRICHKLGILRETYNEALKIYDFRESGSKDYKPNIELIKKLNKEFCEPYKKKRLM